jgi:hypothetical protein
MRTRNQNREEEQNTRTSEGTPGTASKISSGDEVRERARRLLELGDETISHALSQNSERFLEQNRQQGGQ